MPYESRPTESVINPQRFFLELGPWKWMVIRRTANEMSMRESMSGAIHRKVFLAVSDEN